MLNLTPFLEQNETLLHVEIHPHMRVKFLTRNQKHLFWILYVSITLLMIPYSIIRLLDFGNINTEDHWGFIINFALHITITFASPLFYYSKRNFARDQRTKILLYCSEDQLENYEFFPAHKNSPFKSILFPKIQLKRGGKKWC